MLTLASAYLPFPQYLEKHPGERGMRVPCPWAGHRVLLPGEVVMLPCSASPLPQCLSQKTSLAVLANFARTPFLWEAWKGFAAWFNFLLSTGRACSLFLPASCRQGTADSQCEICPFLWINSTATLSGAVIGSGSFIYLKSGDKKREKMSVLTSESYGAVRGNKLEPIFLFLSWPYPRAARLSVSGNCGKCALATWCER